MASIVVEVCVGTHCVMMGSMNIIDAIHSLDELQEDTARTEEIEVVPIPCMDMCKGDLHGPFARVNGKLMEGAEAEAVMAAVMDAMRAEGARP